jgi:hypothetical protein
MPRDHATAMYDNVARRLAECGVRPYNDIVPKAAKLRSKKAGKGAK